MNPPPRSPPLISVAMVTYQHESYLSKAIDSVLAQTLSSEIEILVFDDASTDGTPDVARSYEAKYPGVVRTNMRVQNVGMMTNFVDVWNAAEGEFIALLEGDDFWTDPTKLERQIEHLRSHPMLAGCAHDVDLLFEGDHLPETFEGIHSQDLTEYSIDTILRRNPFGTCSMVYRRSVVGKLPEWFKLLPLGDWPLLMMHACHGPIGRIPREMGTYRIHQSSSWSSVALEKRTISTIRMLWQIRGQLPLEHIPYIDATIRSMSLHLAAEARKKALPPKAESCPAVMHDIALNLRQQTVQLYAFVLRTRFPFLHYLFKFRDRKLMPRNSSVHA